MGFVIKLSVPIQAPCVNLITFQNDSLEMFHDFSSALILHLLFPGQVPEQPDLTGPALR